MTSRIERVVCQSPGGLETFKCRRLAGMQHQARPNAPKLAQWPGGQQPAVADASVIEYGDFNISRHAVMLQTVVADDDLCRGVFFKQSIDCLNALICYKNGSCLHP